MKKKGLYKSGSSIGVRHKKYEYSFKKYFFKSHKFCSNCFNNCVEWNLNISFTEDNKNYSQVSLTNI